MAAAGTAHAALGPRGYELTQPELLVDGLRIAQLSDLHVGISTPD